MENKSALKVRVQKLGTTLSNMVMPNIGAFIAWGYWQRYSSKQAGSQIPR